MVLANVFSCFLLWSIVFSMISQSKPGKPVSYLWLWSGRVLLLDRHEVRHLQLHSISLRLRFSSEVAIQVLLHNSQEVAIVTGVRSPWHRHSMAHSENFTLVQPWNQLFNLVPKEDDGAFASVIGGLQTDSEGQAFSDAPHCQSFLPQGVAVLHQNDIIHYDLKCDNVMVEVNKKCLGLDAPCCFDILACKTWCNFRWKFQPFFNTSVMPDLPRPAPSGYSSGFASETWKKFLCFSSFFSLFCICLSRKQLEIPCLGWDVSASRWWWQWSPQQFS